MTYLKSFFLILLCSCLNSQDNDAANQPAINSVEQAKERVVNDTFSLAERNYQIITKQLNLKSLSQSSSGEEYRIWFEDFRDKTQTMFLLKNEGGRWSAAKYSFATEANDSLEILKTHFSVQTANPKPETIDVQRKIDKLDISKFRDYEKIEGYSACMGTSGIILESLKQGKYHKNFYPCWNTVSTDIKEIKGIQGIIDIFKTDFGFDYK